jgi:CO/xanthine dehydrogenase FAD-binding subunit
VFPARQHSGMQIKKGVNALNVQNYYRPSTLDEALCYMQSGCVKALAGGTDLVIALRERELEASGLVDLSLVEELRGISVKPDGLHIGAMTTFTQIQNSAEVGGICPMLAQAASMVGSPQIRNTGTIGGNLANAATAADTVPVLMAMDAQAVVMRSGDTRLLPVTEIPTGLNATCLAPDELIVEFVLNPRPGAFMDFEKIGRRKALAISRINMALVMECQDGVIERAAAAFGAVGKTAYRAVPVEAFLAGKVLSNACIEEAAAVAEQMVAEVLQGRKTTPYKKKLAAAVLRRALKKAMGGEVL